MLIHHPPIRPPAYSAALRHTRRLLCKRLACTAGEPDDGFAHDYVEVIAEVEAQLRHEETILDACRVRRLQERVHEQRQENAAILAALHHTLPQVELGDFALARQLVAALTDILSLHRISADLALPRGPVAASGPARMRGRAARPAHPAPALTLSPPPPRTARNMRQPAESGRFSFPTEVPMSLQSILVHADLSRHAPARIHAAALLAREHGAHLLGAAMMGVPRAVFPDGYEERPNSMSAECFGPLADSARMALERFKAIASERGVPYDTRLVPDQADDGLAQLSRFADLVVVSQDDPDESLCRQMLRIPDYVILNSARPVLVIPRAVPAGKPLPSDSFARRVLVAWDGSREAAAALSAAVPLLRRAESVTVAMLSGPALAPAECQAQQADLSGFLGRHMVNAGMLVREHSGDTGHALLSVADELGAGLLVMGCYGHSRLRELCLGGASRTILAESHIPTLLAH
jgi:nucleotide-binding universal stress UspA family protein